MQFMKKIKSSAAKLFAFAAIGLLVIIATSVASTTPRFEKDKDESDDDE